MDRSTILFLLGGILGLTFHISLNVEELIEKVEALEKLMSPISTEQPVEQPTDTH